MKRNKDKTSTSVAEYCSNYFRNFFSFILTHDNVLRLQAKKFIANKITIRINSYLPFFDFYVQFTEKGLLFDIHSYDRRIDLEINSTLVDLIKIFVFQINVA